MTEQSRQTPVPGDGLFALCAVAVIVLASIVRTVGIEDRPLHSDEAVNTIQVQLLWERGQYRYEPRVRHGPALAYTTLPFVAASSASNYADTTERSWRAAPLFFGLLTVLLTLALSPAIGRAAALTAGALCAVSPAMTFFSRYLIHEGLLVCFGLIGILCGWHALRRLGTGENAWAAAIGAGVGLGLMHASKETFVIPVAAAGIGLLSTVPRRSFDRLFAVHAIVMLAAAVSVSVLFFSSLFTNASGPLDSILTYASYLQQGTDASSTHRHPWSWYLGLLTYQDRGGVLFMSEAGLALLACVGSLAAILRRGVQAPHLPLARFFVVFTAIQVGIYSAIPYKTPWCVLSALHGMTVLAGIGVVALWRECRRHELRVAAALLVFAVFAHLGRQSWLVNREFEGDERNPWVYAHSLDDFRKLRAFAKTMQLPSIHVYNWIDNAALYFYLRGIPGARFHAREEVTNVDPDAAAVLVAEEDAGLLPSSMTESHAVRRFQLRPNVWAQLHYRSDPVQPPKP